jgi:hypothetical protein
MSKRHWLNLGLLGLAAVLGWLTLVEPGREPPSAPQPLLDLSPAQVDTLRIERPTLGDLTLQRRESGWFLIAPVAAPANPELIRQLLKITQAVCPLHYPAAELELSRLQLEPPLLRLMLNDRVLAFGGIEPLDQQRYVRIGDTVYLCTDRYYYLLQGTVENFTAPLTARTSPHA